MPLKHKSTIPKFRVHQCAALLNSDRNPRPYQFTWQNNADNMQVMDSDKVLLLVYNAALGKAVVLMGGNTRDSGSQSVNIPDLFKGDTLHCYLAFQSIDQLAASTSQLVGTIVAN